MPCPAGRWACEDGAECKQGGACSDKSQCLERRLCVPTACALGYCEPTYPICKGGKGVTHSRKLYLTRWRDGAKRLLHYVPGVAKPRDSSAPLYRLFSMPKAQATEIIRKACATRSCSVRRVQAFLKLYDRH